MKTIARAFVPLFAVLFIAGCATSSDPRLAKIERLTSACTTYAATLEQLTNLKAAGELSDSQIRQVDRAEAVVTPACLIDDPNQINDELLDAALDGFLTLNLMMQEN